MADALTANFSFTKPEVNVSTTWPTSLNADLDSIDLLLANPKTNWTSPTVGATTTCDLSISRVFAFTVSQATTLAFSNVPTASYAVQVDLLITNGAAFVLTFPAAVSWVQGVAPTLQAAGFDRIRLISKDAGVTWYANHIGKNLSVAGSLKAAMGTSSSQAPAIGVATGGISYTATSSGAGSPANLKSYTIPANALATDGDWVRARAWGLTANNANAKTVRINVAGFLVATLTLQASISDAWWMETLIVRTGALASLVVTVGVSAGTAAELAQNAGPAATWSGAVLLQWDCTQTAAVDVTQSGFLVEYGRSA